MMFQTSMIMFHVNLPGCRPPKIVIELLISAWTVNPLTWKLRFLHHDFWAQRLEDPIISFWGEETLAGAMFILGSVVGLW